MPSASRTLPQFPSATTSTSISATIMPAQSTEQSFRDNLSQFRWARGNNDDSQQNTTTGGSNPFSRFYNAIGNGYVPLRSSERSNEEEAYFALSRWERCVCYSLLCPVWMVLMQFRLHVTTGVQITGVRSVFDWSRSVLLRRVFDSAYDCTPPGQVRPRLQVRLSTILRI